MDIDILLKKLSNLTSPHIQEKWDNSGVQILINKEKIKNIVLTLDVTEGVIDFAIKSNSNLIISHHPLIFSGIKTLNINKHPDNLIIKAIQAKINIISLHTNIDKLSKGLADLFCKKLNLRNIVPLSYPLFENQYKVVTFIPEEYVENIIKYLEENNISIVGNYKACSFLSSGFGTFYPMNETSPYIGEKNCLNKISELRIEFIINENLEKIISDLRKIHPYEEPLFDIYPIKNKGKFLGSLGRIGFLEKPEPLKNIIKSLKEIFNLSTIKYVSKNENNIKKIAVCPGSGMSLLKDALKNNVDLFITGDVKYHEALDAQAHGISIIDIGHFHSEFIFTELMENILKDFFQGQILIYKQQDIFKYN